MGTAFELINDSDDIQLKCLLASKIDDLKSSRHDDFAEFIKRLENVYKNDTLKYGILTSNKYNIIKEGEKVRIGFGFILHKYNVDNLSLLNEFSHIENHYYDRPL